MTAVESAERTSDERSFAQLLGYLHGSRVGVRRSAARALGRRADLRAVEPLIDALSDKSEYVRETAVQALAKLGDDRAIVPVARLLPDPAAEDALRRFGFARVSRALTTFQGIPWVDHVRLMELFGPLPPQIRAILEASPGIGFRVQCSGDRELEAKVVSSVFTLVGREFDSVPPDGGVGIVLTISARALGASNGGAGVFYDGAIVRGDLAIPQSSRLLYSIPIDVTSPPWWYIQIGRDRYGQSLRKPNDKSEAPVDVIIKAQLGQVLKSISSYGYLPFEVPHWLSQLSSQNWGFDGFLDGRSGATAFRAKAIGNEDAELRHYHRIS